MVVNNLVIELYLKDKGLVATARKDYLVQDDGQGAYLAIWNVELLGKKPTETELNKYSLIYTKNNKIKELDKYYNSNEAWNLTIKSPELGASITNTQDWFKINLPSVIGFEFPLFTDAGEIVYYNLTDSIGKQLLYKITVEFGLLQMQKTKQDIIDLINNQTTEDGVNAINIETLFENINRIIIIEDFVLS